MMTKLMNKYKKQLDGVRMGKSSYLDFIRDKFISFFFIISWQPKFQHVVEIRVKQSMASVGRKNLPLFSGDLGAICYDLLGRQLGDKWT